MTRSLLPDARLQAPLIPSRGAKNNATGSPPRRLALLPPRVASPAQQVFHDLEERGMAVLPVKRETPKTVATQSHGPTPGRQAAEGDEKMPRRYFTIVA